MPVQYYFFPYSHLKVSGQDTERYLHGRLTQDIKALADRQAKLTLLLNPQGRIQAQAIIYRDNNSFELFSDPLTDEQVEALVSDLLQFKVADDVNIDKLDNVQSLLIFSSEEFSIDPSLKVFSTVQFEPNAIVCSGSKEVIQKLLLDLSSDFELEELSTETLTLFRIRAGYPLMNQDINFKTQAPDTPLSSTVGPAKGCYVGQEVVEMALARGRPNKSLVRLSVKSETPLTLKPNICLQETAQEVGLVTSQAYDNSRAEMLGLALVRAAAINQAELTWGGHVASIEIL